jgi:Plasmid pRiA4b ORF-3-like protein
MNIYRLKVSLAGFKGIRRWFDMSGNCTFDDLHKMIFVAYDRYDQHLYKFYFPQEKTGSLEKIYMSPLIVQHPVLHKDAVADRSYDLPYAARGLPKPKLLATNKAVLDDAELREKQEFFYLFDMGDEWWHKVRVEKIEHEDIKGKSKKLIKRTGDSPPQYPNPEDEEEMPDGYELVIEKRGGIAIGSYISKKKQE